MYQWWLWAHLVSVAGFLLSHGMSAVMGLRLRQHRSPDAVRSLTRLSIESTRLTYTFILLIVVTGVAMGFQSNWWRFGWIWAAIAVLLVAIGAMSALSRPYHNVRVAGGVMPPRNRGDEPRVATSAEELVEVVARANPWPISIVGVVAILILLWLMVIKPF